MMGTPHSGFANELEPDFELDAAIVDRCLRQDEFEFLSVHNTKGSKAKSGNISLHFFPQADTRQSSCIVTEGRKYYWRLPSTNLKHTRGLEHALRLYSALRHHNQKF